VQRSKELKDLTKTFELMREINPTSQKIFVFFALFLRLVVGDTFRSVKIYKMYFSIYKIYFFRAISILQNKKTWRNFEFGDHKKTAVIIVSASEKKKGKIVKCNQEVEQFFGFEGKYIRGKSMSVFMPDVIGQVHHYLLEKYYLTDSEQQECLRKAVLAQHKEGFLLPCTLALQRIPYASGDIQIIGLLQQSKTLETFRTLTNQDQNLYNSSTYLFLLDADLYIIGFNKMIAKLCQCELQDLHLLFYLQNHHKIQISALYPEIFCAVNMSRLSLGSGLDLYINLERLSDALSGELIEYNLDEDCVFEEKKSAEKKLEANLQLQRTQINYGEKSKLIFYVLTISPISDLKPQKSFLSPITSSKMKENDSFIPVSKKQKSLLSEPDFDRDSSMISGITSIFINLGSITSMDETRTLRDLKSTLRSKSMPRALKILLLILCLMFLFIFALISISIHK
jgi:PAS domain S-box-containing protein